MNLVCIIVLEQDYACLIIYEENIKGIICKPLLTKDSLLIYFWLVSEKKIVLNIIQRLKFLESALV